MISIGLAELQRLDSQVHSSPSVHQSEHNRVVCPNFRDPALTSSFIKYKFLQVKNTFSTIGKNVSFEIVSVFEW